MWHHGAAFRDSLVFYCGEANFSSAMVFQLSVYAFAVSWYHSYIGYCWHIHSGGDVKIGGETKYCGEDTGVKRYACLVLKWRIALCNGTYTIFLAKKG